MKVRGFPWLATALLALALGGVASAKSKGKKSQQTTEQSSGEESTDIQDLHVEKLGVESFDAVFDKVGEILTHLQTADSKVDEANANLAAVLGLPEGTPVKDALQDLKQKAADKLDLAMEGTKPKLSVADDAPENIKQAVEAVNALVDADTAAVTASEKAIKDAQALIPKATALPAKIPGEIKNGNIKLSESKTIKNKLSNNIEVLKAIPGAAQDLLGEVKETIELVKDTFSG